MNINIINRFKLWWPAFTFIFIALALNVNPLYAQVAEVESLDVDLTLLPDGSLTVRETIAVQSPEPFSVVTRTLPRLMEWPAGTDRNGPLRQALPRVQSVHNLESRRYPASISSDGRYYRFTLGKKGQKIDNAAVFILRYRVLGTVTRTSDYSLFTWDVSGSGWDVPVRRLHFTLSGFGPLPIKSWRFDTGLRPEGSRSTRVSLNSGVLSGNSLFPVEARSTALLTAEIESQYFKPENPIYGFVNFIDSWPFFGWPLLLPAFLLIPLLILLFYRLYRLTSGRPVKKSAAAPASAVTALSRTSGIFFTSLLPAYLAVINIDKRTLNHKTRPESVNPTVNRKDYYLITELLMKTRVHSLSDNGYLFDRLSREITRQLSAETRSGALEMRDTGGGLVFLAGIFGGNAPSWAFLALIPPMAFLGLVHLLSGRYWLALYMVLAALASAVIIAILGHSATRHSRWGPGAAADIRQMERRLKKRLPLAGKRLRNAALMSRINLPAAVHVFKRIYSWI